MRFWKSLSVIVWKRSGVAFTIDSSKTLSSGICIRRMFEYCGTGPTFSHGLLVCGQSQAELLCPITEPQKMKIILIFQHLNPPSSIPINHWLPFWQQEHVGRSTSESHSSVHLEQ